MTVTVLVPEGALSDTAARLHPPLELETALLDAEAKMLPFASFASRLRIAPVPVRPFVIHWLAQCAPLAVGAPIHGVEIGD